MAGVERQVELAASADAVWALIGGFNDLPNWLPPAKTSVLEEGGVIRRLTIPSGEEVVERLLAHDDAARTHTYSIVEGPLPVSGYVATLSVEPLGAGSRVHWHSTFEPAGVTEDEACDVIAGVYDAGLTALRERFGPAVVS